MYLTGNAITLKLRELLEVQVWEQLPEDHSVFGKARRSLLGSIQSPMTARGLQLLLFFLSLQPHSPSGNQAFSHMSHLSLSPTADSCVPNSAYAQRTNSNHFILHTQTPPASNSSTLDTYYFIHPLSCAHTHIHSHTRTSVFFSPCGTMD